MLPIRSQNLETSDGSDGSDGFLLDMYKFNAITKMDKLCSILDKKNEEGLIKTASTRSTRSTSVNTDTLITLFTKMLSCLDMKTGGGDIKEVAENFTSNLSNSLSDVKTAKKNILERKEEIKIVSKSIKDSHYQIDVSKDLIVRQGRNVFMVSCYARDAYLGRYLIKRNFFYSSEREKSADQTFEEIVTKTAALKDRYYNDIITTTAILPQLKQTLDGIVSEIKIEEDSIATNINR